MTRINTDKIKNNANFKLKSALIRVIRVTCVLIALFGQHIFTILTKYIIPRESLLEDKPRHKRRTKYINSGR